MVDTPNQDTKAPQIRVQKRFKPGIQDEALLRSGLEPRVLTFPRPGGQSLLQQAMDSQPAVRKFRLRCGLCPGDILSMTAALRDLHRANPNRFQTGVNTTCVQLWENNPYVTHFAPGDTEVEDVECGYTEELQKAEHIPTHMVKGFHTFFENRFGVKCPLTAFKGDIHLTNEEVSWTNQVAQHHDHHGPFWIMVAGGKYCFTAKWWNPDYFQEVIDHFRGKIQFVQCGGSRGSDLKKEHFHPELLLGTS